MTEEDNEISDLVAQIQDTSYKGDDGALTADQRTCTLPGCTNEFSTFAEGCNMFASICPSCYTAMKAEDNDEIGNDLL